MLLKISLLLFNQSGKDYIEYSRGKQSASTNKKAKAEALLLKSYQQGTPRKTHSCPSRQWLFIFDDPIQTSVAYFVLFLMATLKFSVCCIVRTKKNRPVLRGVRFIGNLKYSSDRTQCLQTRLSCGLQSKPRFLH